MAIARRVKIRLVRQRLLSRDAPLRFVVVLDESVLHRRCGGRSVMHPQLQRLADTPELPSVTIRIVPLGTDHRIASDSFIIFQFNGVVSIENLSKEIYVEGETDTYQYHFVFQRARLRHEARPRRKSPAH